MAGAGKSAAQGRLLCPAMTNYKRLMHRRNHRQARDRDPQSRQARRDARTAGAARRRGGLGGRTWPRRARRDRRQLRRQCPDQGGRGGQGRAAAGLRRRFRTGGRRARRRARNFLGALGRREQGFCRRDDPDRTPAAGARRDHAAAAQSAFRFRAVRGLARRSSRGSRGARRRHAGVAAARHRRFRLRSDVPARWPHAHLRRNDQHREARPAAAGARAVAPRPRLRQAGGDLP